MTVLQVIGIAYVVCGAYFTTDYDRQPHNSQLTRYVGGAFVFIASPIFLGVFLYYRLRRML